MVYSSSASQRRPCIERECQPRLHQATVHCRHRTPYGDRSAIHHCHKSSTGLPATSVQPSWNFDRSRHSNARQEAIVQILRSRVPSLTCKGMSKHQVCWPLKATTIPGEGMAPTAPSLHTLPEVHFKQLLFIHTGTLRNSEGRRPKTQDSRPLLILHIATPYAFVSLYFYLFRFLYLCTTCVLFRVPCKYFCVMQ